MARGLVGLGAILRMGRRSVVLINVVKLVVGEDRLTTAVFVYGVAVLVGHCREARHYPGQAPLSPTLWLQVGK
jgi:hypothetical protein